MEILNLFLREHLLLAFALVLVSSYIISSSVFPVIIYLSHVKKLTKKPNDRSSHDKSVPTLGGLAIFIGLSITTALVTIIMGDRTEISEILSIVTSTTILLFIGIKDDLMEISSRKKFLTQLVAVLLLILLTGNHITDFYGLLGIHSIPRLLCIGFTVFVFLFFFILFFKFFRKFLLYSQAAPTPAPLAPPPPIFFLLLGLQDIFLLGPVSVLQHLLLFECLW